MRKAVEQWLAQSQKDVPHDLDFFTPFKEIARREHEDTQMPMLPHTAASSSVVFLATKNSSDRQTSSDRYRKRSRHKTRYDHYQYDGRKERAKKRKRREGNNQARIQRQGPSVPSYFQAPNVAPRRLTIKGKGGLFKNGCASLPTRRAGVPDLAFSEQAFLNLNRSWADKTTRHNTSIQKCYVEGPHNRELEQYQENAETFKSNQLHQAKQSGRKAQNFIDRSRAYIYETPCRQPDRPVGGFPDSVDLELPGKPFLGFGKINQAFKKTNVSKERQSAADSSPQSMKDSIHLSDTMFPNVRKDITPKLSTDVAIAELLLDPRAQHSPISNFQFARKQAGGRNLFPSPPKNTSIKSVPAEKHDETLNLLRSLFRQYAHNPTQETAHLASESRWRNRYVSKSAQTEDVLRDRNLPRAISRGGEASSSIPCNESEFVGKMVVPGHKSGGTLDKLSTGTQTDKCQNITLEPARYKDCEQLRKQDCGTTRVRPLSQESISDGPLSSRSNMEDLNATRSALHGAQRCGVPKIDSRHNPIIPVERGAVGSKDCHLTSPLREVKSRLDSLPVIGLPNAASGHPFQPNNTKSRLIQSFSGPSIYERQVYCSTGDENLVSEKIRSKKPITSQDPFQRYVRLASQPAFRIIRDQSYKPDLGSSEFTLDRTASTSYYCEHMHPKNRFHGGGSSRGLITPSSIYSSRYTLPEPASFGPSERPSERATSTITSLDTSHYGPDEVFAVSDNEAAKHKWDLNDVEVYDAVTGTWGDNVRNLAMRDAGIVNGEDSFLSFWKPNLLY